MRMIIFAKEISKKFIKYSLELIIEIALPIFLSFLWLFI